MLLKWTIWLCIYPGGFFHPYPNLAFLLEFPIWKTKNHNNDAINVFLNKNIEKTFIHLWEIFAIKDACKKLWWIQWVYIVMMKMKAKEKIFCKRNSTTSMPYANMIIPFNLMFITIHVMSSRNLFNSFNLSIAKHKTHT